MPTWKSAGKDMAMQCMRKASLEKLPAKPSWHQD